MSTRIAFLGLALSAVLVACGGGNNPPGDDEPDARNPANPDAEECTNLSGMWVISGTCGADLCTITQIDCGITGVTCTSGAHSESGTIDGTMFSYTGESGGGLPATCSGTAVGDTLTGNCSVTGAGTCSIDGDRQ